MESAIKSVRKWGYELKGEPDGQAEIIVCADNFRGRTLGIIGFSTDAAARQHFGPFAPGFRIIPFGNAKALEEAITPNTVAFLVELIQGEAGVIIPPPGYFTKVRELCTAHDVMLILLGKDPPGLQCLTVAARIACFRVKFNRQHQPTPTHLTDPIGADAPQAIEEARALHGRVLDHPFLDEHAQGCPRYRTGERVATEGRAVLARSQGAEHRVIRTDGRHRIEAQTGLDRTGKLLAEQHDGIEADVTLLGKALSGGYPWTHDPHRPRHL